MWVVQVVDSIITHVLCHLLMCILNFSFAYLNTSFACSDWLITKKANLHLQCKSTSWHSPKAAQCKLYSVFLCFFFVLDFCLDLWSWTMWSWGRIHKTHLSATFSLKYGKLPLKLRISLMFQGLHLSIKGFTYLLRNSLNFLRFKGKT